MPQTHKITQPHLDQNYWITLNTLSLYTHLFGLFCDTRLTFVRMVLFAKPKKTNNREY